MERDGRKESRLVDDAASYPYKWRDLKRRNLLFWVAFLAIPAGGAAADHAFPATELGHAAVFVVFALLGLLAVAAGAHLCAFPCPRCGKSLSNKGGWLKTSARQFRHFGLKRNTMSGG
jgi:hypothetical protein